MWSSSGVVQSQALLVCLSLLSLTHGRITLEEHSGLSNYSFPKKFIFGVSTAAFQIEGGWNEGGKGESMWDTYIHQHPDFTKDKSSGDVTADSYHKYEEDIAMIRALEVDYYRMSISWPRLLPHATDHYINEEGVKYYQNIFEGLLKANITPVVTLFHWDLPNVLMDLGGWSNPKIVDYFEDYARVVFKLYGNIVKLWTTVNEPHQHCSNGYGSDSYVPAINASGFGDYLCNHYILLAHARAYRLYEEEFKPHQKGKVGITLDSFWVEPKDKTNISDINAVERYLQMNLGLFAHPIFSSKGNYPPMVRERIDNMSFQQGYTRSRLPYFSSEEVNMLRGSADFFGLNHYTTYFATASSMEKGWPVPSLEHDSGVQIEQNPAWPVPGVEWLSVYPPGFRSLINWITKRYGKEIPIIITENGMSDKGQLDDYERVSYYNEYINQMLLSIYEDDCNVQGYFAWTLMDDFEWNDGFTVKFGVYYVNFSSPKKTRTPKFSAFNLREIARTRRVNFDYIRDDFS